MMTCSMPAATASSTAYWMIGLSTSGSISFGCAFVAGRKRVPQPAAGKTAFRTRIEPHRAWPGRVQAVYPRGPGVSFRGAGPSCQRRGGASSALGRRAARLQGPRERPYGVVEGSRPIEVHEVRRAGDAHPPGISRGVRERAREETERDVVLAVEDECGAGVGGEARDEPFAGQRAQRLGASLRPEPA